MFKVHNHQHQTLLAATTLAIAMFITGCDTASSQRKAEIDQTRVQQHAVSGVAQAAPDSRVSTADSQKLKEQQRWEEFEQMKVVLKLEGKQLKAFNDLLAARNARMQAYNDSAEGKQLAAAEAELKTAKKAKDQNKIDSLKDKVSKLKQPYWDMRTTERAIVVSSLSPQQQKYWAQWTIFRAVAWRWGKLDLTDKQLDQIWQLTEAPANKLMTENYASTDPYLSSKNYHDLVKKTREKSQRQVLTKQQQQKLQ